MYLNNEHITPSIEERESALKIINDDLHNLGLHFKELMIDYVNKNKKLIDIATSVGDVKFYRTFDFGIHGARFRIKVKRNKNIWISFKSGYNVIKDE